MGKKTAKKIKAADLVKILFGFGLALFAISVIQIIRIISEIVFWAILGIIGLSLILFSVRGGDFNKMLEDINNFYNNILEVFKKRGE